MPSCVLTFRSSMIQDNAPVSVAVPTANAKQTIGATLASTRRQICLAPEMVVVDHGSRDGSGSTPYVRRGRLFGRSVPENRFLWQEIAGYVLELLFSLRSRHG
ncbi:glycosyltransferase [Mesorhizobium sp.]|uniref:glycosyltransferase n=2 Tax=Mesorhizobium sp. TaxID=1871066 RepID=UPI001217237E|nr:MAG: glycosyltransferase [Mesorhizobium sp.]TIO60146.1 MAG: glycosyltransferase [Mesorhizobium sp.]